MNRILVGREPGFGQRKTAPRACVADHRVHIRTFMSQILEELGFVVCDCRTLGDLADAVEQTPLDLIVTGAEEIETGKVLRVLVAAGFGGKILLTGSNATPLMAELRRLGEECGVMMLPPLAAPFSAGGLRASVATLLPPEAPPSLTVDATEALGAGWLELMYVHKIDPATLAPRAAEAVTRMRHPAWGLVPAAHFVTDVTDPHLGHLAEFVVQRAMDDWRYFVDHQGPIELSISLPMAALAPVCSIRRHLPDHPAFKGLIVAVKSEELARDIDRAMEVGKSIRLHNIAIAIDDLGENWPSFMDLPRFPFAEIKVHPEIITGCAENRLKQIVCRRILELAKGYGVRTVAKGVKTRADFIAAREMGFDLLQGDFFGKPVAAKKFALSTQRENGKQ